MRSIILLVFLLSLSSAKADQTVKFSDLPATINDLSPQTPSLDILKIESPADGTTVAVGQPIPVNISVNSSSVLTQVHMYMVAGTQTSGLQLAGITKTAPPYQAEFLSMKTIGGLYVGLARIVADGQSNQGPIKMASIGIDIEPAAAFVNFYPVRWPVNQVIFFPEIGQQLSAFRMQGDFVDGSRLYLENSTRFSITTQNPDVAIFEKDAIVAKGLGKTIITLHYADKSLDIPVYVGPKMNYPKLYGKQY